MSHEIAIVLAAGKGTRMRSSLPKVLHPLAGRPMITWPLEALREAQLRECILVLGEEAQPIEELVRSRYGEEVRFAQQKVPRGTGDAVRCALPALDERSGYALILYGDCPLVQATSLRCLLELAQESGSDLAMLTSRLSQPKGYGRILRDAQGNILSVREERDCSPEQAAIQEVNPGIYAVELSFLRREIERLSPSNAQQELYLTDLVERAACGRGVSSFEVDIDEVRGVNDRYELALAERLLQRRWLQHWARQGVTLHDPDSISLEAEVVLETDVVLEARVTLRGRCVLGQGCRIDVGAVLDNVVVEAGAYVKPYTVAQDCVIGAGAQVGPFSHLRPGTVLGAQSHVGNFVELKNTRLGEGSKANHLAYLGDGEVGRGVNIGAGTIFCNYDGSQKHRTVLEDECFIGSDSQLVAPVRIGRGAYVATGTTVTGDVPAQALAISRTPQANKEGYASKLRERLRKKS